MDRVPEIHGVILWGLCQACLTAAAYAATDDRVKGIIAANPGIETHRLRLQFAMQRHLEWRAPRFTRPAHRTVTRIASKLLSRESGWNRVAVLPGRGEAFLRNLYAFSGRSLVLLSDTDSGAFALVTSMFNQAALDHPIEVERMTFCPIPGGGHTFPRSISREEVIRVTSAWLMSITDVPQ
jgi:uncharacterized protein